MPLRERRASHAVRIRDVARLDRRPADVGSANARQEFKPRTENPGGACLAWLQRLSASAGRHMDAATLRGSAFQAGDAAEIRIEARGRGDALNNQAVSYRRATINPITKAIANAGIGAARVAALRWSRQVGGGVTSSARSRDMPRIASTRASDPRFGDCGSGRNFNFHKCSNARTVEQVPKRDMSGPPCLVRHVWSAQAIPPFVVDGMA